MALGSQTYVRQTVIPFRDGLGVGREAGIGFEVLGYAVVRQADWVTNLREETAIKAVIKHEAQELATTYEDIFNYQLLP